jgi:hypothetical protein
MQVQKWDGSSWTTANNITVSSRASQFGFVYVTPLSNTSFITMSEPNDTIRSVTMSKYRFTPANNDLTSTGAYFVFTDATATAEYGAAVFDANSAVACFRHPSTAQFNLQLVDTSRNSPIRYPGFPRANLPVDTIEINEGQYNASLIPTGSNTAIVFYYDGYNAIDNKVGAILKRNDDIYFYTSNTTISTIPRIQSIGLRTQSITLMSNSATDFDKMLVVYSNNTNQPLVQLINYKFPQIMEK